MKSKNTIDASLDVEQNIKEDCVLITRLRPYTPPQITRLDEFNIQSGTTTNLIEASNGAWHAGS